jgi:hypothetical protein
LLDVGLGVLRTTPGAANHFGVVSMRLERLRLEIDAAAGISMPPRLFATKYWSLWFDQYGNVAFRRN